MGQTLSHTLNISFIPEAMSRTVSLDELKQHSSTDSLWIAINGSVYDVTEFIKEHPGGPKPLESHGGQDATESFDSINHSDEAKKMERVFPRRKTGRSGKWIKL